MSNDTVEIKVVISVDSTELDSAIEKAMNLKNILEQYKEADKHSSTM